ncbi:MAG TPA: hypothetical protein VK837_01280 [Longimicrobiales bacterium]|nr:hypothetical protein [Longimicrobiales bacterium]
MEPLARRGSGSVSAGRDGFALLVVLLTLAVLALGLTSLAVSVRAGAAVTASRARVDQARTAAFAAVHEALRAWPAADVAPMPAGGRLDLVSGAYPGGVTYSADLERTSAAGGLVRGHGRIDRGDGVAEWHVARRVALGDGAAWAASLVAALAVSGPLFVGGDGTIAADRVAGVLVDSAAPQPDIAGTVAGHPPLDFGAGTPAARFAGLAEAADRSAPDVAAPAPRVGADGACDSDAPLNWGDPAGGPCGGWAPIVHATGDLRLDGGVGQGILIVAGSLTIGATAAYHGVVLVAGDVRIEPGGLVEGAVMAPAPASEVRVDGTVRLVDAAVGAVLSAALGGRVFEPVGRRWVPMF